MEPALSFKRSHGTSPQQRIKIQEQEKEKEKHGTYSLCLLNTDIEHMEPHHNRRRKK